MSYVLITGGAGYIGSHLVEELDRMGIKSIVYDNLINAFYIKPCKNLVIGDINDNDLLEEVFNKFDIDKVIHLAALIDVTESEKKPSKYFFVNVSGTFNVLSACIRHKVKKFIFASSVSVYGEVNNEVNEKTRLVPKSTYALTKYINEITINRYAYSYGLPFIIMRFSNVNGRGINGNDLVSNCCKKDKMTIYGDKFDTKDGFAIRDYIHVKDVAHGLSMALNGLNDYETYNLSSGVGMSIQDVVNAALRHKKLEYEISDARKGEVSFSVANSDKLKKFGWKPEFTIDDIVKDCISNLKLKDR